jgi:DNA-binding transcriptional regulator/RsmH inhibitor MraZ
MEYLLGKESRKLNVKNQVSIPAEIMAVIRARNPSEYAKRLYLTLEYTSGVSVPFIKCFDQLAFEKAAKDIIPASEMHAAKIDAQERIVIPRSLMDPAQLDSLDRIVIVEACSGNEWGLTFGIYEMDNYHKMKAGQISKVPK